MDIIAVILRDEVLVEILDHVALPLRLPALKPARGPTACPAGKQAARSQFPADDGFFADPDYSEFYCMDEPPVVEEKARDESKEARQPSRLPRPRLFAFHPRIRASFLVLGQHIHACSWTQGSQDGQRKYKKRECDARSKCDKNAPRLFPCHVGHVVV